MLELSHMISIALIVALGVLAQWFAWRIGIPAILPLLVVGFFLGPLTGLLRPEELIGRDLLLPLISLAVGLILFEGGMTLRLAELKQVRQVVINLITVGALVTWFGATAAAYYIVGLSFPLALLFGSLIIVTGPTVIVPLLRTVRPTANVANVLKWEGILIDPVGVLVAVLVFEFLMIGSRSDALGQLLWQFVLFIAVGGVMGALGGFAFAALMRRHLVPHFLINVTALALVFTVFSVSHAFAHESGLLATVVMGMLVANLGVPNISNILSFKENLSVLLISLLFIVLAANVDLSLFAEALTLPALLLLAAVMLVVRPLTVLISSIGSKLTLKERLFTSWIGPRGIVTAAVTSLFAARLVDTGLQEAELLVPLVFLIIIGTVTLNGLTARPVARALGLAEPDPQGFLILGAHKVARRIGAFLQDEGFKVILADTNPVNVYRARSEGLSAYNGSLLSDFSDDDLQLSGIGQLLALTSNDEANALTALKYTRDFGPQHVFQLEPGRSRNDRSRVGQEQRGQSIFSGGTTFAELNKLFEGGKLKKLRVGEDLDPDAPDPSTDDRADTLPLFIMQGKKIMPVQDKLELNPGSTLVALVQEPVQNVQVPDQVPVLGDRS